MSIKPVQKQKPHIFVRLLLFENDLFCTEVRFLLN